MRDIKLEILAVSQVHFARFGFRKTTVDEICRDCRISKKTLYQHFKSKNELFTNLLTSKLCRVQAMTRATINEKSSPLNRLPQLLQVIILCFLEDNFLAESIRDETLMLSSPSSSSNCNFSVEKEITTLIANVIQEGKKQNQFRDVDEKFVAYLGFKLLQTAVSTVACSFDPAKTGISYSAHALIDLLVNGIAKKDPDNMLLKL